MSFFTKGDFKTREEWLKKQKKSQLRKEEEKFNKNIKANLHQSSASKQKKEKLNQIITLDTQQSIPQKAAPKWEINPHAFKNEFDASLFSSMQTRLHQQQQLRQKQRLQLSEINKLIQQTKTQNTILKAVNLEIPSFQSAEAIQLTNKQLLKRASEMEAYLNSHGAFYEGSAIVGQFNLDKIKKDIKEAKTNYRTPTIFQFSTIEQRIQQLNENLMKEMGSKRIVNAQGINKFKQCDKMNVVFFKNGVKFEGINFYEYATKDGLKILDDLTEGYYPHILKKIYPDGVIMLLQNKIGEIWNTSESSPPHKHDWFFGKGHSLEHD